MLYPSKTEVLGLLKAPAKTEAPDRWSPFDGPTDPFDAPLVPLEGVERDALVHIETELDRGVAADHVHRTKVEKRLDALIALMLRDRAAWAERLHENLSDDPIHGKVAMERFYPLSGRVPALSGRALDRLCRRYAMRHWSEDAREGAEYPERDRGLLWFEAVPRVRDRPDSEDVDAEREAERAERVKAGRKTTLYVSLAPLLTERAERLGEAGDDAPDLDAVAVDCADVEELGFDPSEAWNFDGAAVLNLYPRFHEFRRRNIGWDDFEYGTFGECKRYMLDPIDRGLMLGCVTSLGDFDEWCEAWCHGNGLSRVASLAMQYRAVCATKRALTVMGENLPSLWW